MKYFLKTRKLGEYLTIFWKRTLISFLHHTAGKIECYIYYFWISWEWARWWWNCFFFFFEWFICGFKIFSRLEIGGFINFAVHISSSKWFVTYRRGASRLSVKIKAWGFINSMANWDLPSRILNWIFFIYALYRLVLFYLKVDSMYSDRRVGRRRL